MVRSRCGDARNHRALRDSQPAPAGLADASRPQLGADDLPPEAVFLRGLVARLPPVWRRAVRLGAEPCSILGPPAQPHYAAKSAARGKNRAETVREFAACLGILMPRRAAPHAHALCEPVLAYNFITSIRHHTCGVGRRHPRLRRKSRLHAVPLVQTSARRRLHLKAGLKPCTLRTQLTFGPRSRRRSAGRCSPVASANLYTESLEGSTSPSRQLRMQVRRPSRPNKSRRASPPPAATRERPFGFVSQTDNRVVYG